MADEKQKDIFGEAIKSYISTRQPPVWPLDLYGKPILFTQRTLVPDLAGTPKNCLPLLLLQNCGLKMIGILTNTNVLMAEVSPTKRRIDDIEIYPNFIELFEKQLARFILENYRTDKYLVWAIYWIDEYKENIPQLRWYYPKIAPLFVEPPTVSPKLRQYAQDNEIWPSI